MTPQQLSAVLSECGISIRSYDPSKPRSISVLGGGTITLEGFKKRVSTAIGARLGSHPGYMTAMFRDDLYEKALQGYAKEKSVFVDPDASKISIPERYESLTLNIDESYHGRESKYLLTSPEEIVSEISANVYLKVCGISDNEAALIARKVFPRYEPRSDRGIMPALGIDGVRIEVLNTYIPPKWTTYEGELPDELPALVKKVFEHVLPLREEREFNYAWYSASIISRAPTYLIYCGAPGAGKNRLKLILRALHGESNSVDGKKSTLTEKFNSQIHGNTMGWFDELHYNSDMENVMKEIQNGTISIERKGVDATRSTKIYTSMAISNNKPRDNYIAFDARKFAPLVVNSKRLETSMTHDEIDELSRKFEDESSPHYDVAMVAQTARWLIKHWSDTKDRWPNMEYRGPMFYKLAHTSMSRWQKKAAEAILLDKHKNSSRVVNDPKLGYLWSTVDENTQKKNGDKSLTFPDPSTVMHFFNIFVDGDGIKSFKTTPVEDSIMGDFYVKVVHKAKIIAEHELIQELEDDSDDEDESYLDIL